MDKWFRKNLGDAMLAFLELDHVEIVCLSAYKNANCRMKWLFFFGMNRKDVFNVRLLSTSLPQWPILQVSLVQHHVRTNEIWPKSARWNSGCMVGALSGEVEGYF